MSENKSADTSDNKRKREIYEFPEPPNQIEEDALHNFNGFCRETAQDQVTFDLRAAVAVFNELQQDGDLATSVRRGTAQEENDHNRLIFDMAKLIGEERRREMRRRFGVTAYGSIVE